MDYWNNKVLLLSLCIKKGNLLVSSGIQYATMIYPPPCLLC